MCLADGATQALGGLRDNDQVNMIGHQAICPVRDLLCAAESRDELEVVLVVFLTEERLLSAVSPLGDMVGHARSYHTCQSSHGEKLTRPQPRVKSQVWCPQNSAKPTFGARARRVRFFAVRSSWPGKVIGVLSRKTLPSERWTLGEKVAVLATPSLPG